MNKRMNRYSLFGIILCLVLCLMPATVFADGNTTSDPITSISGNGNQDGMVWNITLADGGILYWENGNNQEKHSIQLYDSDGRACGGIQKTEQYQWDITSYMIETKLPTGRYSLIIDPRATAQSSKVTFYFVSPLPKLSEPQNLYWDKTIGRWDPVPNATSYQVSLLDPYGSTYRQFTVSDTFYDFTDVLGRTGQMFTVVACADNYLDSTKSTSDKLTAYFIDYNPGSGTGSMKKTPVVPDSDGIARDVVLPDCGFTAPEGMVFDY